ncbi:hypothetical protein GCM10010372_61830 [Streptomyces tauricus]|nr:hypothetical protein GCM10010372_61830 [Streptomyces tauricus]
MKGALPMKLDHMGRLTLTPVRAVPRAPKEHRCGSAVVTRAVPRAPKRTGLRPSPTEKGRRERRIRPRRAPGGFQGRGELRT